MEQHEPEVVVEDPPQHLTLPPISCTCDIGAIGSWECNNGEAIYYCPHVMDSLYITTTPSNWIPLTQEQCEGMQNEHHNLEDACPFSDDFPFAGGKTITSFVCYPPDIEGTDPIQNNGVTCNSVTSNAAAPTALPTEAPTSSPTGGDGPDVQEVVEITDAPVAPPTEVPVAPPSEAPVVPPTDAPVGPPVEPEVVVDPLPPTEAPIGTSNDQIGVLDPVCPMDYVLTGSSSSIMCGSTAGVNLIASEGIDVTSSLTLSDGTPVDFSTGTGIIFNIVQNDATVSFDVNNPFSDNADVFVDYETASPGGFLSSNCDGISAQSPCLEEQAIADGGFEAACRPGDLAIVRLYFATDSPTTLGFAGTSATVDGCCEPQAMGDGSTYPYESSSNSVGELVYTIKCGCPTGEQRKLRGAA
jgi:hypothetical protein